MKVVTNLFNGRLGRKNYIKGLLSIFIPSLLLVIITDELSPSKDEYILELIALVVFFVAFILCITLFIRRLHDINKSGKKLYWAIPALIIPFIWIYIIYLFFITFGKGDEHANVYGEKPADTITLLSSILNRSNN